MERSCIRHSTIFWVETHSTEKILGTYLPESEGDDFWLQVLTDLNNRELKNILIAYNDNLKGFTCAKLCIFQRPRSSCASSIRYATR
ncbi:transposase [Gelidibacter salicanalis]|uniref:Transposase n=2 Tax=Gelidibacter salicanalis TaxID=291193 RepID=A0A934KT52_9FLAO|nr:transposase [Gelidibacter salicanalis]